MARTLCQQSANRRLFVTFLLIYIKVFAHITHDSVLWDFVDCFRPDEFHQIEAGLLVIVCSADFSTLHEMGIGGIGDNK
jgi:hypothetical protein